MQIRLIAGLALAIAVVVFAVQNIAPVTVTLGLWRFEGSLALVLLLAFAAGVVVAALVASLAALRERRERRRLEQRLGEVERALADAQARAAAPAGGRAATDASAAETAGGSPHPPR
jgi:putative membrane protein